MNENERLERFNKEYSSEAGITNQNIISFNTAKLIKSKGLLGGSCIQLG